MLNASSKFSVKVDGTSCVGVGVRVTNTVNFKPWDTSHYDEILAMCKTTDGLVDIKSMLQTGAASDAAEVELIGFLFMCDGTVIAMFDRRTTPNNGMLLVQRLDVFQPEVGPNAGKTQVKPVSMLLSIQPGLVITTTGPYLTNCRTLKDVDELDLAIVMYNKLTAFPNKQISAFILLPGVQDAVTD